MENFSVFHHNKNKQISKNKEYKKILRIKNRKTNKIHDYQRDSI